MSKSAILSMSELAKNFFQDGETKGQFKGVNLEPKEVKRLLTRFMFYLLKNGKVKKLNIDLVDFTK